MRSTILMSVLLSSLIMGGEMARDKALEVGSQAPEWTGLTAWINSEPVTLKSMLGKVVLVRWWTAPQCPFCKASAPALNSFHEQHATAGLQVIGMYHHKNARPLAVEDIKLHAEAYGFKFPIAIDPDWVNLRRWWFTGDDKDKWTSVSFLIDRKGIVRHIHPGGQYIKGDAAHAALEKKIIELLAENP